jgi:FKBP-type peptidyl-prolyl cis-trans isomerase FklB
MKKTFVAIAVLAAATMTSCGNKKSSNIKLNNATDSLSYAIGLDLGDNLGQSDLSTLNLEIMMKGIQDQLDSVPDMELLEARQFIQMEIQNMMEAKAEKGKDEGVKFLEENKMKDGVQTTPSGLQYKVIQEGNGAKPAATDVVKVHYHGTLISGEVFDSSVDRGEPVSFPLNQVIPGWTEGLQLMSKGSKYMFYIPENLGYGSRSMGNIKPYSTLIFEVELLDINPAE